MFAAGDRGHIVEHNRLALLASPVAGLSPDYDTSTRTGTDNTAALNDAIAALNAAPYGRDNAVWSDTGTYQRPTLLLPPGRFLIGDLDPITFPYGRIIGAGREQTVLHHQGTVGPFTFGTFDSTPANAWVGTAGGWAVEGLTLVQDQEWHGGGTGFGTEGSRTRTAIRDNHGGGFRLRDVRLRGFQYGFAGASGSDFTTFQDCNFEKCDVGAYLGPRSQQLDLSRCFFDTNQEGLVVEGAKHGRAASCWFNDHTYSAVVFETRDVTRFGLAVDVGPEDTFAWALNSCWFENAANAATDRVAQFGLVRIQAPSGIQTPRWVHLSDSKVVAGAPSASYAFSRSFVRVDKGTQIKLENTRLHGELDGVVHNASSTATPNVQQIDSTVVDGYSMPLWLNDTVPGAWVGALEVNTW